MQTQTKIHKQTNHWLLVDNHSEQASPIERLRSNPALHVLNKEALKNAENLRFAQDDKICITSETVLDIAIQRIDDQSLVHLIETMKNKVACREMLRDLYPNFYFEVIPLWELPLRTFDPTKKYVLKPVKGYHATAVRIFDTSMDLNSVVVEVEQELERNLKFFPTSVLSQGEFFVEEFIEGEEYAVDMFYSETGEPVILNIYHHPIPQKFEYLHALYYTSADVFALLHDRFVEFFRHLNQSLQARRFPIHGEFKFDGKRLVPIELNPVRFGGSGLADLAYHAFGFNPFEHFFLDKKPDWQEIWASRRDKLYAWVLGYNGSGINVEDYRPHLSKFRGLFTHILSDVALNYQNDPAFAVIYIEEYDLQKIYKLVNTEFKEYFVGRQAYSEKSYWAIYRRGIKVSIPSGAMLWQQGDLGDYLVLVLDGTLEIIGESNEGKSVVFTTAKPGAVVGELSALDGLPRSAAVRASTPCEVMKISGSDFRDLLHMTPDLLEDLYWQQVDRVRRLSRQVVEKLGA